MILLVPIALLLCLGAFVGLPNDLRPVLFGQTILNLIGDFHEQVIPPEANVLITVFLTLIQALLLNRVVNQNNLLGKSSFLPALLYVSLASMLTPFLVLSPTLICNFLIIWMIDKFLSIYRRTDVISVMFDLGLIVAIGTLFYFPFIAMFLLLWISLLIFRPFNWREWVACLVGFITIYFMIFIIYFWLGRITDFYQIWLPLTRPFPTSLNIDIYDYLVLLIPIVILVLFTISLRHNFYKSVVHIRKSFQLLFFMFLLGVVSFYQSPSLQEYHFLLCIPPISIYTAYYFSYAKVKWVYESIFALLIIGIIYFQWF